MKKADRECYRCGVFKKAEEYRSRGMRYCKVCKSEVQKIENQKKMIDHRSRLWYSSFASASRRKLLHTIKKQDIPLPERCVYLDIPLDYTVRVGKGQGSMMWNAPSIDRIDSTGGYTPDNIQVISFLANLMKQDASTSMLIRFAKGVIRVHSKRGSKK